jgi:hypothetical protein
MKLAERQGRLDAALSSSRDWWQPQPFCESRPAWCAAHPAITEKLLALDDAAAEALNDDARLAAEVLQSALPDLPEVLALATLPARTGHSLQTAGDRWAWEIPGRKRRQIEAFANAMRPGTGEIIDWCGGKGHLGRLLALEHGVPVRTLDIDASLCAAGETLAERLRVPQKFHVADALTAGNWPQAGQHAVALHACGELHRSLLKRGAECGTARLDVAPCCYHRGVGEFYQPLSGGAQLRLRRDDTRLAVTESVTAPARERRQRDRRMAWKLGFDAWRRQCAGDAYRTFKPVPEAWMRASFGEFITAMAQRENLPPPSSADGERLEASGWQRQREVARLSIVRHAFRRALEVWLALDLAVFLEERGYAVELGEFCRRELTPRNLLISARRAV